MSLKNVKIGDEIVSFPYGLGKVDLINLHGPYPIRIEFNSSSCYYVTIGGALYYDQPTSCWPINEAPEWVWGALGIKKPKPKKKVTITKIMYGNFDGGGRFLNIYSTEHDD